MKIVVILFFVLISIINADVVSIKVEDVIKKSKSVTKEKYPNSNLVLLDSLEVFEYKKDGTSLLKEESFFKILDEEGKNSKNIISISYDEHYGKAFYEYVAIIKESGEVVEIDLEKNSSEKINPAMQGSNIYEMSDKIIVVNIPNLEIGDTLYTKEQHITKKPLIDGESSYSSYGENFYPILHKKAVVVAPKDNAIVKSEILSGKDGFYSFKEEGKDDKIYYIFEVNNVPLATYEPNMITPSRTFMRFKVSTINSWGEISKWYYNLAEPRIDKTTDEIKEKAMELIKGASSEKEKYENIFFWVSRNIRYFGDAKEENRPGFEPHDVSYTFETMTGVCRDKAALIVAMLRAVNIESYMILMNASTKIDEEVPMSQFNHAIACVVIDGENILMDPTSETSKNIFPEYLANKPYLVAKEEGSELLITPNLDAKKSIEFIKTDVKIEGNSYIIDRKMEFKGYADVVVRSYLSRIDDRDRYELIKYIAGDGELISYSIEPKDLLSPNPLIISYKNSSDDILIGKEYKMLPLKIGESLFMFQRLSGYFNLGDRETALEIESTGGLVEEIRIEIDSDYDIEAYPENQKIEGDGYSYKLELKKFGNGEKDDSTYKSSRQKRDNT